MDGPRSPIEVKVKSALSRLQSLQEYVDNIRLRSQTSPGIQRLISVINKAIHTIKTRLTEYKEDDFKYMRGFRLEKDVNQDTQYIPHIAGIVSFVENTQESLIPYQLLLPLRRELLRLFPNSELIITAEPKLTISIRNLRDRLDRLSRSLGFKLPHDTPTQLFRIALPAIDNNNALHLMMMAHEFGHPLSEANKKIDDLEKDLRESLVIPSDDATTKNRVDVGVVKNVLASWLLELCCDIYAIGLFGPAYFSCFIYAVLPSIPLDQSNEEHPPPRLRLRIMLRALDNKQYDDRKKAQPNCYKFIEHWRSILAETVSTREDEQGIIHSSLSKDKVINRICDTVLMDIHSNLKDKCDYDSSFISDLIEYIDNDIPPMERLGEIGDYELASLSSILNAAWEAYLGGLEKYRAKLPKDIQNSDYKLNERYNEFIMKALELNEVKRTWMENSQAT